MPKAIEYLDLKGLEMENLTLYGDLRGAGRVFSMTSNLVPEHMEPVSILCRLSLPNTEIDFWADARLVRKKSFQNDFVNMIYAVSRDLELKEAGNLSEGHIKILDYRPLPTDSVISQIKFY
jgi:hypothetical protein